MPPVSRRAMAAACALSAGSMLAHNLYELPLSPIALENSGPTFVAALLGVAYAAQPGSRAIAAAALGWGVLNFTIGAVVTILPLPILPFSPEQSFTHYGAHLVYGVGQVPLLLLAYRALRRDPAAASRSTAEPIS